MTQQNFLNDRSLRYRVMTLVWVLFLFAAQWVQAAHQVEHAGDGQHVFCEVCLVASGVDHALVESAEWNFPPALAVSVQNFSSASLAHSFALCYQPRAPPSLVTIN